MTKNNAVACPDKLGKERGGGEGGGAQSNFPTRGFFQLMIDV